MQCPQCRLCRQLPQHPMRKRRGFREIGHDVKRGGSEWTPWLVTVENRLPTTLDLPRCGSVAGFGTVVLVVEVRRAGCGRAGGLCKEGRWTIGRLV